MGRVCCVSTCKEFTKPGSSLSFFAFPYNNEELKKQWLEKGPGYKTLSKYSYICSKHFLPDDYTEYNNVSRRVVLKKNAVPSIFNDNDLLKLLNQRSEMTTLPSCIDDCDVVQSPMTIKEERKEYVRPAKKLCSVAVQTCPRLSGPTDREMELQHKIKILQDRLRYKEKRLKSVQDLVTHLKETGKCSEALEETFLKTFSEFDLEIFKNQAHNNKVAKSRKEYTPEMKKFASTLYVCSPRAYKYVRAKINLPHTATLKRWI